MLHARLFATPWTVASQASLSMEFPRQEYWSELPFHNPGDLSDPGIEPRSPVSLILAGRFFTTEPSRKPLLSLAHNCVASFAYSLKHGLRPASGLENVEIIYISYPETAQSTEHSLSFSPLLPNAERGSADCSKPLDSSEFTW